MAVLTALVLSCLALTGADGKLPLRVLYLGNPGTPRMDSYAAFLTERFAAAETRPREGFDPAAAAAFDVVLLDWSQQDVDLGDMAHLRSPLGPRAAWAKPTVLLGSAGLLIASEWRTTGAYG